MKLFRVAQKLDQLLDFILGFLDTGDIAESDLVLVTRQHSRFRFPKVECAFSGHSDLLPEQEIEDEQEQRDWQKTNHGLRDDVRFRLDRRLNPGGGKFLLKIVGETQINRRSKWNLLRRC